MEYQAKKYINLQIAFERKNDPSEGCKFLRGLSFLSDFSNVKEYVPLFSYFINYFHSLIFMISIILNMNNLSIFNTCWCFRMKAIVSEFIKEIINIYIFLLCTFFFGSFSFPFSILWFASHIINLFHIIFITQYNSLRVSTCQLHSS